MRSVSHGIDFRVWTLSERPELAHHIHDMKQTWPEFTRHDMFSGLYYQTAAQNFPDYVLMAAPVHEPDHIVAMSFAVPVCLPQPLHDEDLPDGGWDQIIRVATLNKLQNVEPNVVCALEVTIREDFQGVGLSEPMLVAMRNHIAAMKDERGDRRFAEMIVAVRPNCRGLEGFPPPMDQYAAMTRDADGLPVDPWLRVHKRVGGRIAKVAKRSMVIPGTLKEWREWTGLPFDVSGQVFVPGGLVPVLVDVVNGCAVYVEPNVWVRHSLGDDWGSTAASADSAERHAPLLCC